MSDGVVLALVPVITAFIGYVTNWAAIKMMFHPAEPVGIGPLKWQGIVYRMSGKFAAEISATTSRVLSPEDLVQRMDVDALVQTLMERHGDDGDQIIRAAFETVSPGTWDSTEVGAREGIRTMLLGQVGSQVEGAMTSLGPRLPEMMDLDALIVAELTGENSERLARVANEIGGKELRFIELYGGVFGFIIGLVQVALFGIFGIWWTMPIVGGLVGLGTNWLAIQMVFRPLEPKKYLGLIRYQGMFPKRQAEIARDYGLIAEREIFTPSKLLRTVVDGPGLEILTTELRGLVATQLETFRPMLSGLAGDDITDDQIADLVVTLERELLTRLPDVLPTIEEHLDDRLQIAELIEERLGSLDKLQFERMLRGIFEEDEWILIVVGGALGALIGVAQGLLVRGFDI